MGEIIHGVEEQDVLPDKPIGCIIFDILKEAKPDNICIVDLQRNEKITYQMLLEYSLKLSQYFKKLEETEAITNISIISENNWEFVLCMLSALYFAKPIHLINSQLTMGEISHLLSMSRPSVVLCSSSQVTKITQLKDEAKFIKYIIVMDGNLERICRTSHGGNIVHLNTILSENLNGDEEFLPESVDMEDIIFILNTSGTTGMPKCAMQSHRSMKAMISAPLDERFYGFKRGAAAIIQLPAHHMYGLLLLLITMCARGIVIIMNKFEQSLYLKAVEEYDVPMLFVVPTVLNSFLKNFTENHRRILQGRSVISGAAPMEEDLIHLAEDRLQLTIRQCYGMTEAGVVLYPARKSSSLVIGSSGAVSPGVQLKVVDLNTNEILPRNAIGELCFKGPMSMAGYLNDEVNTRKIIDIDGFIHTGDIGYCQDDGSVFVVDRMKDIIKFKGVLVSPSEIESIILQHPFVKDAAVTFIPDEHAGELPVGLVAKKEGCILSEEELITFVQENISYHKRLHGGVKFVKEIPKNSTGKILRNDLRRLL